MKNTFVGFLSVVAVVLVASAIPTVCAKQHVLHTPADTEDVRAAPSKPNVVVFFIDDMGWGDLECYGHPTIKTPHINRLAEEGMRFTQWLSASAYCTPSRAGLMTGRLPIRYGLAGGSWLGSVLAPDAKGGLPLNETTLAEVLQSNGYATKHLGKWHLGQRDVYMPTNRGFDEYLGIPYSHDMGYTRWNWSPGAPMNYSYALPLVNSSTVATNTKENKDDVALSIKYRAANMISDATNSITGATNTISGVVANSTIVEQPVRLSTLTQRYTASAVEFLRERAGERERETEGERDGAEEKPFFLYMAYNHVHVPMFCNEEICNTSKRGMYGDAVSEVDKSVGQIMASLKSYGFDENTLVILTSDNGPWLTKNESGGSAGLLRGGKASTWEGGFRVPGIYRWKGQIPENVVSEEVVSTLDIFPTVLRIANISLPTNLLLDGKDISDLLLYGAKSPHDVYFYYRGQTNASEPETQPGLWAVRYGSYKVHFITRCGFCDETPVWHDPPLIFNLEHDPSEQYPLPASDYSNLLSSVSEAVRTHQATLYPVANQNAGSDMEYALCCDRESRRRFPEMPLCTCDPENYFR